MNPYLNLLKIKHTISGDIPSVELESQEILIENEINKIHEDHKIHFSEYMAEMYNSIPEHESNQIADINSELYKFNYYTRDFYVKYMIALNNEVKLSNEPNFDKKYIEMKHEFNNSVLFEYFNKPMMNIEYVFLVFKKLNKKYIPDFYNFKELNQKHLPILIKIQELIKAKGYEF